MAKIYVTKTKGITEAALRSAFEQLPRWRADKAAQYKNNSDKINGVFSYLLLKKLVNDEYGDFDASPFTYGKHGKPYFAGSFPYFSLSHCKTAVAASVSEYETGLDILDDREINEKTALRICSERELEQLEHASDKQYCLRRLWCEKESLAKLIGVGFTQGFKKIDTTKQKVGFFVNAAEYMAAVSGKDSRSSRLSEISWESLI